MYCRNCAELLADTDITCPRCGFAVGSGVKYCGTCGTIVEPGAVICDLCGNPVNPTAFNGQQAQAQYGQQYAQQQQFLVASGAMDPTGDAYRYELATLLHRFSVNVLGWKD